MNNFILFTKLALWLYFLLMSATILKWYKIDVFFLVLFYSLCIYSCVGNYIFFVMQNLLYVIEVDTPNHFGGNEYLGFEKLTFVPIQVHLLFLSWIWWMIPPRVFKHKQPSPCSNRGILSRSYLAFSTSLAKRIFNLKLVIYLTILDCMWWSALLGF